MDFAALAPIVAVLVVGAISPGPSLAILIRNTLEGGKRRGVACGIGHGIGFGIYAFIAIAGIAQLKASASGAAELLEIINVRCFTSLFQYLICLLYRYFPIFNIFEVSRKSPGRQRPGDIERTGNLENSKEHSKLLDDFH